MTAGIEDICTPYSTVRSDSDIAPMVGIDVMQAGWILRRCADDSE